MRTANITRNTKETQIELSLNLDSIDKIDINTGVGFFDHMLNSFALHAGIGFTIHTVGDTYVDCHHSIEDSGIALGKAIALALGDKGSIVRYGNASIPMDEALGVANLDISGRPYLVFNANFTADRVGDMDTQMVREFFGAVCFNAGITLHISCPYGDNDHHKIEALFKAFAHALRAAIVVNNCGVLSTKGVL